MACGHDDSTINIVLVLLLLLLFICCVTSYDKCKPMDSKMKPLWLVWKNLEQAAGTKDFENFVMFKKGDGMCY